VLVGADEEVVFTVPVDVARAHESDAKPAFDRRRGRPAGGQRVPDGLDLVRAGESRVSGRRRQGRYKRNGEQAGETGAARQHGFSSLDWRLASPDWSTGAT
jgi:hypothetical protein